MKSNQSVTLTAGSLAIAPDPITLKDNEQVTIGDLHGNALKLIWFLKKYGYIDITRTQYNLFRQFYAEGKVEEFVELVGKLAFTPESKNHLLRLIGDVLADRGENDWMTLAILKKMDDEGVPFEIDFSNHDMEFSRAVGRKGFLYDLNELHDEYSSVTRMKKFMDEKKGKFNHELLNEMIDAVYSSDHFKLISYAIDEGKSSIEIFTHAPYDFHFMEALATFLKVSFEYDTLLNLKKSIDGINQAFSNYIKSNELENKALADKVLEDKASEDKASEDKESADNKPNNRYYFSDELIAQFEKEEKAFKKIQKDEKNKKESFFESKVDEIKQNFRKNPLYAIAWQRDYDHLDFSSKPMPYEVAFTHGHHTPNKKDLAFIQGKNFPITIKSIDQVFGKDPYEAKYEIVVWDLVKHPELQNLENFNFAIVFEKIKEKDKEVVCASIFENGEEINFFKISNSSEILESGLNFSLDDLSERHLLAMMRKVVDKERINFLLRDDVGVALSCHQAGEPVVSLVQEASEFLNVTTRPRHGR